MTGLAFEQARQRVAEALLAGSLGRSPGGGAIRVDADMIVAMHSGVPREAVLDWAGELAVKGAQAVRDGTDPLALMAGLVTQGMLTGFFTAEEIAKDDAA